MAVADGSDGEKRSEGRERESIVRGRVRMRGREFMKSLRVHLVGGVEKREDRKYLWSVWTEGEGGKVE